MCLTPVMMPQADGKRIAVACKGCRICRDNRVNDMIGRCIAEQCSASKTFAVTLTYKGDGPETALLRYWDVQLLLKRLRKHRYSVRYICAGEYGTLKGRAHWHIILFFYGRSPDIQMDRRVDWSFWPHGFVYFQNPDYKGFRYALKYALKSQDEGAVKSLSMSKKPPLGHDFFKKLADDLVEAKLPIHSPDYAFAHVRDKNGSPRKYWLQGRMREIFLDRYYIMWRMIYKCDPPYTDFFLERYLDPIAKQEMENDSERFERDRRLFDDEYRRKVQLQAQHDRLTKRHGLGWLLVSRGQWCIAYSDDTGELEMEGGKCLITGSDRNVTVAAQLLRAGLNRSKVQPVVRFLESEWMRHRSLKG